MKKLKILTLSDHPLMASGVGLQTKIFVESMLKTGKYEFVSLAGAMKHSDKKPIMTREWQEDWRIFPVDNYGTKDIVRSFMQTEKPDMVWIMTDPRFWGWLWEMEDEIRANAPLIYYHVWDNYPVPKYNKKYYKANDCIVSISKLTSSIVRELVPEVIEKYIPHAVDPNIFKRYNDSQIINFKEKNLGNKDTFVFFWNNRNARRKQSTTLIWWFKEFLDKHKGEDIKLLMHTDPKDPYGSDLNAVIDASGVEPGRVLISKEKISSENLAMLYSASDCTINISDAEGFGLSTLESLSCETPIIVTMTGGLQEQVTDGNEYFGIGIEPTSKTLIGSQTVPYIFEDRISKEDFLNSLDKFYSMSKEERRLLGKRGKEHLDKNYNLEKNSQAWDKLLSEIYDLHGSWENRKNYKTWELIEL